MSKTYIWDSEGVMHIAAHSVGDYGESRGVFNSHEWFCECDRTPEEFFEFMTGEKPVRVEDEEVWE